MTVQEIGTLADGLKFGISIEESIEAYYRKAAEDNDFTEKERSAFSDFADAATEIKDFLEEKHTDSARSDMDMGALEPVSGIEVDDYAIDSEYEDSATTSDKIEKAIAMEDQTSELYTVLGNKVSFLSSKQMSKLTEQKEERISQLKSLL